MIEQPPKEDIQESYHPAIKLRTTAEFAGIGADVMIKEFKKADTFFGKFETGFGVGMYKVAQGTLNLCSAFAAGSPDKFIAVKGETERRMNKWRDLIGHEQVHDFDDVPEVYGINDANSQESYDTYLEELEKKTFHMKVFLEFLESILLDTDGTKKE